MAEFPQSLIGIIKADPKAKPSPGATDEQIAKAEAEAGFSFPPSYKQFLLHFNGGEIGDYNVYGLNYAWEYDRDIIDEVQSSNGYAAGIQEGDVYPFGATWGGDCVCFDLREKSDDGEYPILYWNHEESEGGDPERLWKRLADNFAKFMQETYEDIMEYDYGRINY